MADTLLNVKNDVPKSFHSKLIDHLLNIRLTLMVKKLISDTISRKELRSIIKNEEESAKDKLITEALDETFEEYFKEHDYDNDNQSHNFEDHEEKGISLVKRGYFKSDDTQDLDGKKAA